MVPKAKSWSLLSASGTWRVGSILAAAALAALLVLFLVVPVLRATSDGFFQDGRLTLGLLTAQLADAGIQSKLVNSVKLAGVTTAVCLLISVPLAIIRARCTFRGQGVLGTLLLLPLILPPFVGGIFIQHLLGQDGILNLCLARIGLLDAHDPNWPDWMAGGFAGTCALQAMHLFPILYLNASAALANVDPTYSQAARNLGAGPWRTFWHVTLPLMRPGLFAGGTLVFIWAFTDLGTPIMAGYENVLAVHIYDGLRQQSLQQETFSLVFLMLSSSLGLYIAGKFIFGRPIEASTSKASIAGQSRRLGPLGTLGAWVLFGGVIFVSVLPHVGVALDAFSGEWVNTILPSHYTLDHIKAVFEDEATYQSIINSIRYAGTSTAIDLAVGVLAAWLIVRSNVPFRGVLDGLTMLPLAVPGLILAAGYMAMTAPGTALSSIGPRGDPFLIIVVAYAVRRLPVVVRGVSAGLEQVPLALEEAARNLGASRARAAWSVTVPLITANLLAAGVLTFAFAVLEVSDSLVLAQRAADYPITKQIWQIAKDSKGAAPNVASALGLCGMVLLGGTMALASALLGKRLGAVFRA